MLGLFFFLLAGRRAPSEDCKHAREPLGLLESLYTSLQSFLASLAVRHASQSELHVLHSATRPPIKLRRLRLPSRMSPPAAHKAGYCCTTCVRSYTSICTANAPSLTPGIRLEPSPPKRRRALNGLLPFFFFSNPLESASYV